MLLDNVQNSENAAQNEQEKRTQVRRHLVYYLRVFDGQKGGMVGHLADLTSDGLMVVFPRPLEVGQSYRLRLIFPRMIANRSELLFEGNCRWCRPDINPDLMAAGLQIQGMAPEDTKFLMCLIDDFAFKD